MKNQIDLSIIIVSYNTKILLDRCLTSIYNSLETTDLAYEVIVVDNNSQDGSIELLKNKFVQVKLIQNKQNLGFGKGNNQGIAVAKSDTILLLNSDIEVLNQAIIKMYQYYQTLSLPVIIGGKLLNPDGSPQPSCGPEYNLFNIFIALFLKGDYLHITRYSPSEIKKVDWVMGACMMMNKSILSKLNGFDEGIFMYMEEIEFQHRAKKTGIKIMFYPNAEFIHIGSGSSFGKAIPILNVFHGLIYFYKKHYSKWHNMLLRIILLLKAGIAILLFTLMNKKDDQKLYNRALKIALQY